MTIELTIRKKIMAIALGLIVLMVITAILSFAWVRQVEDRIQALDRSYIPAYGHLARTNIRSKRGGISKSGYSVSAIVRSAMLTAKSAMRSSSVLILSTVAVRRKSRGVACLN